MIRKFTFQFFLFVLLCSSFSCQDHDLENGDIIFQTSKSSQSQAIQLATHSKYSHMGILYEEKGRWYVFEAVGPVKLTALDEWIKRGEDSHFVVKRLKNAQELLSPETLRKMREVGKGYLGKNYDLHFEWSDERIYCSELVWKIYHEGAGIEIGELEKLGDFDLGNEIVQKKLAERYGTNLPLDEKVISPVSMFNSDKLVLVQSE